jgi:acetyl-CoA carboxylase alpha subunit
VGDRVLIQQFAIFSVIPPEGCSAILWRDANRKVEAAAALKLTAPDLLKAGIVDEIVAEPVGGAHQDPAQAARLVDEALARALAEVAAMPAPARLEHRYRRLRQMGRPGVDFADTAAEAGGQVPPAGPAPRSR